MKTAFMSSKRDRMYLQAIVIIVRTLPEDLLLQFANRNKTYWEDNALVINMVRLK
jgi:hypothetical protein